MTLPKDMRAEFNRTQRLILAKLRNRPDKKGLLARRGSKMQELVTRLRLTPPGGIIRPGTCAAHGYAEPTVKGALTRMILAGELERVAHGVYRLTGRTP